MTNIDEELVLNALRTVNDPELGQSVVDLNMVRAIRIEGGCVEVDLVLTTPGCPLAGFIILQAQKAVGRLSGVEQVDVNLLDEPWEPPENDWQSWVNGALGR